MSAPAIGQRWRLKSPVDVENFAVGKAGDMGTIVEIHAYPVITQQGYR